MWRIHPILTPLGGLSGSYLTSGLHGYVLGGHRAATDTRRVIEYLAKRGDVNIEKIGWIGSSSTGIPGLAVATQGPRLAAIVAFVSTGAYAQWLETWHTNGLWRGTTKELWPETKELLKYDPIRHVDNMFPTAVLMVNGGEDKIVDPATARAFVKSAQPFYEKDPERLRLIVYEDFGHNLPLDVVKDARRTLWFPSLHAPDREAPAATPLASRTLCPRACGELKSIPPIIKMYWERAYKALS